MSAYRVHRNTANTSTFDRFRCPNAVTDWRQHRARLVLASCHVTCRVARLCRTAIISVGAGDHIYEILILKLTRFGSSRRVEMMDVVTPPFRVNAWLVAAAFVVAAIPAGGRSRCFSAGNGRDDDRGCRHVGDHRDIAAVADDAFYPRVAARGHSRPAGAPATVERPPGPRAGDLFRHLVRRHSSRPHDASSLSAPRA